MNGLNYIRKRCNFSLSELADQLGVTRQAVSAWENGRKEIPKNRKKQLSEFFGLAEERFFGEINEDDMYDLLQMALYRYDTGDKEKYSFRQKGKDYYYPDMLLTLDEQLINAKKRKALLMERISDSIDGLKTDVELYKCIKNINRMCKFYENLCDILEHTEDLSEYHKESGKVLNESVIESLKLSYDLYDRQAYIENTADDNNFIRKDIEAIVGYEKSYREYLSDIESEYEVFVQGGHRADRLIMTYGIEDITNISEVFGGKYIVSRADNAFSDCLAIRAVAIFFSSKSLSLKEYEWLNDLFQWDDDALIFFDGKPAVELKFDYFIVDPADKAKVKAIKKKISLRDKN